MVTYADLFNFVIMLCAVVTMAILVMKHKKQRSRPARCKRYFCKNITPTAGIPPVTGSLVRDIIRDSAVNYKTLGENLWIIS